MTGRGGKKGFFDCDSRLDSADLPPHPPKTHSHNSKIVFDMGGWRR